jgi:hypothetical protein
MQLVRVEHGDASELLPAQVRDLLAHWGVEHRFITCVGVEPQEGAYPSGTVLAGASEGRA